MVEAAYCRDGDNWRLCFFNWVFKNHFCGIMIKLLLEWLDSLLVDPWNGYSTLSSSACFYSEQIIVSDVLTDGLYCNTED